MPKDFSGTGQELRFTPQSSPLPISDQGSSLSGWTPGQGITNPSTGKVYPAFGGPSAVDSIASAGSAGLMSSVPWLGVANLFAGGIGAFFDYQAAKKQAEQREREYQEGLRRYNQQYGLQRDQFTQRIREFEVSRKDSLNELKRKKMQYMVEVSPKLKESARRMRQNRYSLASARAYARAGIGGR